MERKCAGLRSKRGLSHVEVLEEVDDQRVGDD